jgi:hypothetical protein
MASPKLVRHFGTKNMASMIPIASRLDTGTTLLILCKAIVVTTAVTKAIVAADPQTGAVTHLEVLPDHVLDRVVAKDMAPLPLH